jgi:hypothetical protein
MFKRCYFCGAPATSKEHVPPANLFPENKDIPNGVDYRKNLITVPSCDVHNSKKSKDDEYLLLILTHGYFNNTIGKGHFNKKVIRALIRRPAMLVALYGKKTPVTVDTIPTVAVNVDPERFYCSIERVCRGLYFHHYGERWSDEIEIRTPILLSINEPYSDKINEQVVNLCKAIRTKLDGTEKLGNNQDIFWYQLFVDKARNRLLCRMTFYEGFDIFAISDPLLKA